VIIGKKPGLLIHDAQSKLDVGVNKARELVMREKCEFLIEHKEFLITKEVTHTPA
jgi:hypothetical protein